MSTVHETLYTLDTTVQSRSLGWFISEAREFFSNKEGNFYVSSTPVLDVPLKEPLNAPSMLANGYKELGLWIPTNTLNEPHAGILLSWADETYPTPRTVQYLYIAETGHAVMAREITPYNKLRNMTLSDIITRYVY